MPRLWQRGLLVLLMVFLVHSAFGRKQFLDADTARQPREEEAVAPPTGIYSEDEIDYFLEVSLGAEYGNANGILRKWTWDIVLEIVGAPTESDLATVEDLVEEISALQSSVPIRLATESDTPNLQIVFVPRSDFFDYEPNYVPPNPAYFWVFWNGMHEITEGRILIDTALDPDTRAAFLREEFTQALGLLNTSSAHPESVLNDHTDSHPDTYAPIDERLIEMLFRPEVQAGMRSAELDELLRGLGPPEARP